jgi:membrane associated rhomboid family serine protease
MFPIRDTIPSRNAPVMTWALIALNVAVFLFVLALPEIQLVRAFHRFGLVPAAYGGAGAAPGLTPGSYWAFTTSMFLHGGFFHLLANMWMLWIFGDNVEDRMGPARFLAFYLACGFAAGLLHWLSDPSSTVPTVGASGAIAGVLGAYLLLYPRARVVTVFPILFYPLIFELPALVYLGFWFVLQLQSGVASLGTQGSVGGVAWWAHVGGFVAGMVLLRAFLRRRPGPQVTRHGEHILVDLPPSEFRRR